MMKSTPIFNKRELQLALLYYKFLQKHTSQHKEIINVIRR